MFRIEMDDEIAVLTPTRRFEGKNRATAREQIDELFDRGITRLVLDFSLLDRIDSSGLASVVSVFRRARDQDGDLHLCGLNHRVQGIFELTLLNDVIPIFPDKGKAVSAFKTTK